MKKCCGTCRFYQKGAMSGAGWCRHPDRIDVRSDLVLERASLLGCRRSWDEHSWEPIRDEDRGTDRFDNVRPIGPVPPASPAEIGSLLEAERRTTEAAQQQAGLDEDRVVGTAPSPIPQVPRALLMRAVVAAEENGPDEGPAAEPDKRETILRAREVQRARVNNRIRPSVQPLASAGTARAIPPSTDTGFPGSPDPGETPAPPPASAAAPFAPSMDGDVARTDPVPPPRVPDDAPVSERVADMAVRSVGPAERVAPPPPVFPYPDYGIPSGSPHPEYDLPSPKLRLIHGMKQQPQAPAVVRFDEPVESLDVVVVAGHNEEHIEDDIVLDPRPAIEPDVREDRVRPAQRAARKPKNASFSFRRRWNDAGRGPVGSGPHEQQAASVDSQSGPAPDSYSAALPDHEDTPAETGLLPEIDGLISTDRLDRVTEAPSSSGEMGPHLQHERGPDWAGGGRAPTASEALTQLDVVVALHTLEGPIAFDPSIDDYVIAPDVARTCETCSAFRPANGGGHGWCSNGWAFDSRRFVGGQGVPCASSVGDWWLPNDDYWDDGVIERLTAPAPMFDREVWPKYAPVRQRPIPRRRGR